MRSACDDLLQLQRMLERERDALKRGDLAEIERFALRMNMVLDRLEVSDALLSGPANRQLADGIIARALGNRALIEASMAGLRDAQALLARARIPQRHATYARDGRRESMSDNQTKLERRA